MKLSQISKVLGLGCLFLSVAAQAQNVSRPKLKGAQSYVNPGLVAALEGTGGAVLSYTMIKRLVGQDLHNLSQLNAIKDLQKGIFSIDLNQAQFDALWAEVMPQEWNKVMVTEMRYKKAVEQFTREAQSPVIGFRTTALKKSLASRPQQVMIAEAQYHQALGEFFGKRAALFNPAEAELFQSAAGQEARAAISQYVKGMRTRLGISVLGSAVGVYMIIDTAHRVAALIDGERPGVAPIFMKTAE